MTLFRPLRLNDRAQFTRQFAHLIHQGVPPHHALSSAAHTLPNRRLRVAADRVRTATDAGARWDDVLAQPEFSTNFDPLFVAFVRTGRDTGSLVNPLMELTEIYRWQLHLQRKVRMSLILPGILATLSLVMMFLLLTNVIPTFVELLTARVTR